MEPVSEDLPFGLLHPLLFFLIVRNQVRHASHLDLIPTIQFPAPSGLDGSIYQNFTILYLDLCLKSILHQIG